MGFSLQCSLQVMYRLYTVQWILYSVQCTYNFIDGQRTAPGRVSPRHARRTEEGGGRGGRDRDLSLLLRQSTGDPLGRRTVCSEAAAYSLSGAKVARVLLPKADRSFNRKELHRSFLPDEFSKTKIIFYSDMFDMVVFFLVKVFLRICHIFL